MVRLGHGSFGVIVGTWPCPLSSFDNKEARFGEHPCANLPWAPLALSSKAHKTKRLLV